VKTGDGGSDCARAGLERRATRARRSRRRGFSA
jgi:hypothetical protein